MVKAPSAVLVSGACFRGRYSDESASPDAAGTFVPVSGKAVRVLVAKGSNAAMNVGYKFRGKGRAEPEEIYFRYYLRIGDDWWPDFGGKLPGISGTYGVAGWGGRPSAVTTRPTGRATPCP